MKDDFNNEKTEKEMCELVDMGDKQIEVKNSENTQKCDNEIGTCIHKSLKSMNINDPLLFGMIPKEEHKNISFIPLINCNYGTSYPVSKFSLVETQKYKCNVNENDVMKDVMKFENSELIYGDKFTCPHKNFSKRNLWKQFINCFKLRHH